MIEPRLFGDARREPPAQGEEEEEEEEARRKAIEAGEMEEEERERKEEEEEEDGLEEGLLQMKLPESVKLEMCNLLQYFCERELQHRVEAIVAFSERHVERLQRDQRRRYGQLMRAMTMSAAETARRTREFRSPPQEQVNMLLQYKGGADEEDCPVPEDIRDELLDFHNDLLAHCGIELVTEEEEEEEEASLRQRLLGLVQKVLGLRGPPPAPEETPSEEPPAPSSLQELISQTMVHWAQESFIQSPELVRAMFSLLHRQYDGLGELCRALPKAYSISARSVPDTQALLQCLGQIRSLLIVQMGPEEEMLMIQSIGNIMNNRVFYQHPNLMRALGMHETVMQVMVSVLGGGESKEIRFPKMVTNCCRFLCYFCRISRQNQRAMFDHLGYLLENSSIGLGMRGSTPLDVAAASVIDNNELALALKEQDLEKVVTYLASCGLQSCPMLLAKGYPDIGWNPCGGERYLDFLRFAVFVNGESVEENANVVVRLLIRRPECFGPALRGEGGSGLLAAIQDAIAIAQDPARDGPSGRRERRREPFGPEEPPEETRVHLGNAIMSFYAALIDLLGRCAPEMHLIQAGKGEALRIRAILRSLVPLEDLVGVISLPLQIPALGKDGSVLEPRMAASFVPEHKAPMVLFLDRVYGVESQEFLLRVLEVGFLPDMRAAASLDTATFSTTEMALALNRYLCQAVLPLVTKCAPLFAGTEHRAIMVDSMLHTVYRLSRGPRAHQGPARRHRGVPHGPVPVHPSVHAAAPPAPSGLRRPHPQRVRQDAPQAADQPLRAVLEVLLPAQRLAQPGRQLRGGAAPHPQALLGHLRVPGAQALRRGAVQAGHAVSLRHRGRAAPRLRGRQLLLQDGEEGVGGRRGQLRPQTRRDPQRHHPREAGRVHQQVRRVHPREVGVRQDPEQLVLWGDGG
ncbi:hypothetical protein Q9966_016472 [Columba livia]|nr:hypothetical protein Q9966_016472 [Columba livia]